MSLRTRSALTLSVVLAFFAHVALLIGASIDIRVPSMSSVSSMVSEVSSIDGILVDGTNNTTRTGAVIFSLGSTLTFDTISSNGGQPITLNPASGVVGIIGGLTVDSITTTTANTTLTLSGAGTGGVSVGTEAFLFANLAAGGDADGDIPVRSGGVYVRKAIGASNTVFGVNAAGVQVYQKATGAQIDTVPNVVTNVTGGTNLQLEATGDLLINSGAQDVFVDDTDELHSSHNTGNLGAFEINETLGVALATDTRTNTTTIVVGANTCTVNVAGSGAFIIAAGDTLNADTVQAATTNGDLTIQANGSGDEVVLGDFARLFVSASGAPVLGGIYYDSALKAPAIRSDSAAIASLVQCVFQNTASSTAITAAGATAFDLTYTPAVTGSFNVVGRKVRIALRGVYTSTATPGNVNLDVLMDGASVAPAFALIMPALQTGIGWSASIEFTVRTNGASGSVLISAFTVIGNSTGAFTQTFQAGLLTSKDVSGAGVITVVESLGTAGGNSITLQDFTVEVLH